MLDFLFFTGLALYFAAMVLTLVGMVFKKEKISSLGWYVFLAGAALETAYLVYRGIVAGRLPLSNQFEFAASFSWGIAVILIFLHYRFHLEWIESAGMMMNFLIISYAALQPREVTDLMPALRSAWFGFHIGSAAFSYASFMLAGAAGIRYLIAVKKDPEDERLEQMDYFIYRLIALGLLLLTVTILTGAIWAEEAYKNGRRTTLPEALVHGIGSVFSMLVVQRGFMDGWMGICLSCMYCFYTMQKYLKLHEMQNET